MAHLCRKILKCISTFCFCFVSGLLCDFSEEQAFLESFIFSYDASVYGKFTHEYHGHLYRKSSESYDALADSLAKEGLDLKGRIVLTGYEEHAVPSYFTNYRICTGSRINDEVRVKGGGGWTQQLHNKFGVMTGYLFRDVPIVNDIHKRKNKDVLFDHINLHVMPIYDQQSYIFQRHAFGDMLKIMEKEQVVVNKHMLNRNARAVFAELTAFWNKLYEYELRFGNREVLGTQDILFSIAHAQHLIRSKVPMFKYYLGPDITYPIKVTRAQKQAATYNAQTFVKEFVDQLKPIDEKSTVYIFCSFVDGVGKSTLLGNVQNYKKYGTDFASYDPVDNSSSQLAQLFKFDEKVFIADLPAQMSHFTYKPDGMVYFDVLATNEESELIEELRTYVFHNKVQLIADYTALLAEVNQTLVTEGAFAASLSDKERPERAFVKNVLLLKRRLKNTWIPFSYKGKHYLFDSANLSNIRQLVKLELADSIGLKNCEAEQMLFLDGVRFPLPYSFFVDDLIEKFKKEGIEQVVFVNFLSMYPRSSRENIRVNYLLQQLALLYDEFSPEESFYGSFTSDAHLLYKLKHDKERGILFSLKREAFARLSLYKMMERADLRTVEGIPLKKVTRLLQEELAKLPKELIKHIDRLTHEKIKRETFFLERVHGKTQNFVNIQSLNFDAVVDFGERLQQIFSRCIKNERIKELWREPGDVIGDFDDFEGAVNQNIVLSDGTPAQLLYVISPECKDEIILNPLVRTIRSSWFLSLANLIGGRSSSSKIIKVEEEKFFVPPVWVKKTRGGKIAVFRRIFEGYGEEISDSDRDILATLNVSRPIDLRWGLFQDKPYYLSLDLAKTNAKMFAFGNDATNFKRRWLDLDLIVSSFIYDEQHKSKQSIHDVIPAAAVWKGVEKGYWFKRSTEKILERARTNTKTIKKEEKEKVKEANEKKEEGKARKSAEESVFVGAADQVEACRIFVRGVATLETIIKDPQGEVAVFKDSKKDFMAALKLVEKIVLPAHFHLIFEKDLFRCYQDVKPL